MLPTIFLSRGTTIYACISQQFPILSGILYPLGSVLLHAVAVVTPGYIMKGLWALSIFMLIILPGLHFLIFLVLIGLERLLIVVKPITFGVNFPSCVPTPSLSTE